MASYNTGSDPIEIDDIGSKVKVTVAWNMSKFVNKMLIELVSQVWRSLPYAVAFSIGSSPIEICDLRSKVKVTVTWKKSKNLIYAYLWI